MFKGVYEWFPYDKNSKKSINSCIFDLIDYMHKYSMPYFEKGSSCKDAYGAIGEFEVISRAKVEKQEGVHEFSPYSSIRACMALKWEHMTLHYHLEIMKAQCEDAYATNLAAGVSSSEYKVKMENKLLELDKRIQFVSEINIDNINNFINRNEQRSLQDLGLSKK